MRRFKRGSPVWGAVAAVVGLVGVVASAGCSPALDWRDVRAGGSSLVIEMPCKPDLHERRVSLAGATVLLTLQACDADGRTWGLASADVGETARVGPALAALLAAAAGNIGAAPGQSQPFAVKGAVSNADGRRVALLGRRPQGPAVQMVVAVFARGTRVHQMTALGETLPAEALESFLGSARFAP
jgi:hypothetical protein